MNKTMGYAAIIGTAVLVVSSAVAQANPTTSMPAIESAARQVCGAMLTAVHHVCPQREALVMEVANPIAAEELCTEPT